ncbi:MAG: xanthine dehydrogenase family protein subunit M [Dehalococcoidales bacterium]|nr:xanthine dehydrogenase family protein subunit M [Dehalococcoidales bacterium]
MARIDFFEPSSLRDAVALLAEYGEDAKVLAGGQSLLMLMRHRFLEPQYIVSLGAIANLNGIRESEDGAIVIGAMTTQRVIERSPLAAERCNIVSQAASVVASVPVRNLGTLGGNLCHGDPSADPPAALIAAGATLNFEGPAGKRSMPVEDFFVDYLETALLPGEILTEIALPPVLPGSGAVYLKCSRRAVDFAIVGVGATVRLDKNGSCDDVRIGLNGVDVKPFRSLAAERVLRGVRITDSSIKDAAMAAADEANPLSDSHASADYRRRMAAVFTERAVRQALQIAVGDVANAR